MERKMFCTHESALVLPHALTILRRHHFAPNAILRPTPSGVILERSEGSGRYQNPIESEILHFVQNDSCGDRHLAPTPPGVILERSEGSGRYHHFGGE